MANFRLFVVCYFGAGVAVGFRSAALLRKYLGERASLLSIATFSGFAPLLLFELGREMSPDSAGIHGMVYRLLVDAFYLSELPGSLLMGEIGGYAAMDESHQPLSLTIANVTTFSVVNTAGWLITTLVIYELTRLFAKALRDEDKYFRKFRPLWAFAGVLLLILSSVLFLVGLWQSGHLSGSSAEGFWSKVALLAGGVAVLDLALSVLLLPLVGSVGRRAIPVVFGVAAGGVWLVLLYVKDLSSGDLAVVLYKLHQATGAPGEFLTYAVHLFPRLYTSPADEILYWLCFLGFNIVGWIGVAFAAIWLRSSSWKTP